MGFDAVFFDSGGTLYQDNPPVSAPHLSREVLHSKRKQRLATAMEGLGYSVLTPRLEEALDRVEKQSKERPLVYTFADMMADLLKTLGLPESSEDAACLADAYAGPRYRIWLFPGTANLLQSLVAMGIHVGLIANTAWPSWSMDRAFHGVGILRYLVTRVYSGDEQIVKPDPRIFKLAESRSGLSGKRILYVGDSIECDVKGARTVQWSAAFRRSSVKSSNGLADFEFDENTELLEWITKHE